MNNLKGFRMVHIKSGNSEILRERRVTLGLTQKQVAEKAGILLQHYQGFEGGQRNLLTASFKTACSVLEALDLDIARFFHNDYVIGENVFLDKSGLKYSKTGRNIEEDVE